MPNTERNKLLAILMNWIPQGNPPGSQGWLDPAGGWHTNGIPDFCGSDECAVKWLLPFLIKQDAYKRGAIRWDENGLVVEQLGYPMDPAAYEESLSLALAAAVEHLKGGEK